MITVSNSKGVSWAYVICVCVMIVFALIPFLSRNGSLALQFVSMVLAPLLVAKSYLSINNSERSTLILLALYISIETLYKLIGISTATVDYYFTTVKFFWFYVIFFHLKEMLTFRQRLVIIIVSLMCFIYTTITNDVYAKTYDHYISMYQRVSDSNAANTSYSSMTMLLAGCFYAKLFDQSNKLLKILYLAGIILCGYYMIFIAERGAAFFLSLTLLFLITINVKELRVSRIVSISTLLILLFLFIEIGGINVIVVNLSQVLPDRLVERLLWADNVINTGQVISESGTLSSRFNLTLVSLKTFFSSVDNFVLGVGDHRDSLEVIGNHNQWIDAFARYGIFGGILLSLVIYKIFDNEKKYYLDSNYHKRIFSCIFFIFYIRGFLGNVIHPSIGVVLFIIMPILFSTDKLCSTDKE